jgi:hypothetical protein
MKLATLIELEDSVVQNLHRQALQGDNEAARVLLEHLRATSTAIESWRAKKEAKEESGK